MTARAPLQINSDDIELAGALVQELGSHFGVRCRRRAPREWVRLTHPFAAQAKELPSTADFPRELANMKEVLQRVEAHYELRQKLSVEMADSTNLLKMLVRAPWRRWGREAAC